MALIKGIELELSGRTFVVPPLALGDLEVLQDKLKNYKSDLSNESICTVLDVAHAALKRNYPEITRDELGSLIDIGNMPVVMMVAMDVAGLRRKEVEAQGLTGEALMAALTSLPSTPQSPPQPAGNGTTSATA
jgi:hypothetical protein